MDVGFIGLGQMGSAIAVNLVKAGHRVTVYNRSRAKAEALTSQGVEIAETPADACRRPVLITMLADDAAVEGVFFGDGNGLSALGQGAVHISMSTISVAFSDRLAEAHRKAGQAYVAAPVFGRPEAAAAAKLFVVATLMALSFNQLNLFKYMPIDHNPRAYKIHQMHLSILNKIVDLNTNCQNRILTSLLKSAYI